MIEEIQSQQHLSDLKKNNPDLMMILFHTDSSEKSNEALEILDAFHKKNSNTPIFKVNASKVNDIHPLFGINSVPTMVVLKKDRPPETILGIQTEDFYKRLVNGHRHIVHRKSGEKSMRVSVYSSDGCPWCTKAKSYLKKVGIPFRDINVSHDENAAKEVFRRSGQRGTPQIDINGQIIVGFDQPKIDKLLGLN